MQTAQAVADLLSRLEEPMKTFAGSQCGLPLCEAVLGRVPGAEELRGLAGEVDPDEPGEAALTAALVAECCEAGRDAAAEHFVSDSKLRGLVFSGSKWRAGWAFLLGEGAEELAEALENREFIVFESAGSDTHAVYWLQMMVRYAMIWGQVPPGEDHEMSHLLEDDLPGVLIVRGRTSPVESLLALAMMKMGCPAIVPEDFPFQEGRQARLEGPDDILDAVATLPNLRVKESAGRRIALPDGCNPAHARESFTAERTVGGELSFFCLRPARRSGGTEVSGTPNGEAGVLIEIGDERLDLPTSRYLEDVAANVVGYLPGLRVTRREPLELGLAKGAELQPERLAEVLRVGLQWNFPRLEDVHVRVTLDEAELRRLKPDVDCFRQERRRAEATLDENSADRFVACIECQSFSHSHVCVVTPDRPPMCGRDPGQVRAAALFGATWHPYRRRGLQAEQLRELVEKGRCLDAARGEYEGINQAARRLTEGQIGRVFLHSLDRYPHSSCGCFHNLAFRIDGLGIGVMHRGFEGSAPNGETWDSLANRAGGKQADGVTGCCTAYLRSPRFMQADGGLAALVWATEHLLEEIEDALPEGHRPATEKDAADMEELLSYLQRTS